MPWECKTVEKIREEFIEAAKRGQNVSKACRQFEISRTTAYKWLERAENGEAFSDRSRAPKSRPKRTNPEIEDKILAVRDENPGWGGKKIHQSLINKGEKGIPCAKTCCNILKRNDRILPEESLKHVPFKRFEREKCNQMWQTDFKGEFKMADKKYCYPLTILDDHSRFSIKIEPHTSTANVVIPAFEAAFREFGMPDSMLSDNGAQFAGFRHGFTQYEKWLMNNDILPIHERVHHPQTQGKN